MSSPTYNCRSQPQTLTESHVGLSSSSCSPRHAAWVSALHSISFIQCPQVNDFFYFSLDAFKYFRRLDYSGVILNIIGTGIAPIYYSLYCNTVMTTVYLSVMVFFGGLLFLVLLQDWIHEKKNQKYKPIMFCLFGLTYIVPYTHFMLAEILFDNFGDTFKFS